MLLPLFVFACAGHELRVAWQQLPDALAPFVAAPAVFTYEEQGRISLSSDQSTRVLTETWGEPAAQDGRLVWDSTVTQTTEKGTRTVDRSRMFVDAQGLGYLGRVGPDGSFTPYSPPMLVLPAELAPGQTWEATHQDPRGDRVRRCALRSEDSVCPGGFASVCETQLPENNSLRFTTWWCPNLGLVGYEALSDSGGVQVKTVTRSATRDGAKLPEIPGI